MLSAYDPLGLANFGLTAITAACALYLSYAALKHSAKPKIRVRMTSDSELRCGTETLVKFEFDNVGYWYGAPIATGVVAYCNFSPEFSLHEILYGSDQELTSSEVRTGVGGMKYLKARGLTLAHGEAPEGVHVRATTPEVTGRYVIRVTALSENGASFSKTFRIRTSEDHEASDRRKSPRRQRNRKRHGA